MCGSIGYAIVTSSELRCDSNIICWLASTAFCIVRDGEPSLFLSSASMTLEISVEIATTNRIIIRMGVCNHKLS